MIFHRIPVTQVITLKRVVHLGYELNPKNGIITRKKCIFFIAPLGGRHIIKLDKYHATILKSL